MSRCRTSISSTLTWSGGFGAVGQRARADIGRDLADGYVSAQAARADYGVTDVAALAAERKED